MPIPFFLTSKNDKDDNDDDSMSQVYDFQSKNFVRQKMKSYYGLIISNPIEELERPNISESELLETI